MVVPLAFTPGDVTHGLTLKGGQLSWAILNRHKTVENRSVRLPLGWIALHTGLGKLAKERSEELAALCPGIPAEASLVHGYIVGAMRVDRNCTVEDCAGKAAAAWAHGPKCNIIGAVCPLAEPIAHKGALGTWPIDADVLQRVRDGLSAAPTVENDIDALLPLPPSASRKRPASVGADADAADRDCGSGSRGGMLVRAFRRRDC